jgi:LmbE family N-acetylglucosaminyl deacetylase
MTPLEDTESAIVFAPHQDDETLGCGGTIARKKQAGAIVKLVFLTDGRGSHADLIDWQQLRQMRQQEAIAAAQVLGVPPEDVQFLDFPDGELAQYQSEAIAQVVATLDQHQPQQIFLPYHREPQFIPDHPATHHIVWQAVQQSKRSVTLYEYPIWFWCHWPWMKWVWYPRSPLGRLKLGVQSLLRTLKLGWYPWQDFTTVSDIRPFLAQKQQALDCHASQMVSQLERSDWTTLAQLSDGDFLACFAQPQEIFYRRRFSKPESD